VKRGLMGEELIPGRNVDVVNVAAGLDFAVELGYESAEDEMVTQYSLNLWARGEEDRADRNWVHYHPHDLTQWRMIIATAVATPIPREEG
jgi:hypothetical protein